jgi:hypothetical protein
MPVSLQLATTLPSAGRQRLVYPAGVYAICKRTASLTYPSAAASFSLTLNT